MIKILHNNLIIDISKNEKYVKYSPQFKRFISCEKDFANGILGSDNDTVYHLAGKINNFPIEVKTVTVQTISEEEYEHLSSEIVLKNTEKADLKKEVDDLKQMVQQQNDLIQQLISKLS